MSDPNTAWALFLALRANQPGKWTTDRVLHYEAILEALENTYGVELSSFRVPPHELKPRAASIRRGSRTGSGLVVYGVEKYAQPDDMKRRLDGLALYFEALERERADADQQQKRIGFIR